MQSLPLPRGGALVFHDLPGQGAPILFVHGLGCAGSADYVEVAAAPPLLGHRRVLVDLPGFGFAPPMRPAATLDCHAEAIVALAARLDLRKIVLYGHSMGGAVAIRAATLLGSRLGQLVLCEPNLVPGGGPGSRAIAAQSSEAVAGGALAAFPEGIDDANLWKLTARTADPQTLWRGAVDLVEGAAPSWLAQLVALSCPKAAIYGGESLPDPDHDRLLAAGIPLRVLDGLGHDMAQPAPARLAAALAELIAAQSL